MCFRIAEKSDEFRPFSLDLSESKDEEDCISSLEKVLDILNSMGSPPDPTRAQLKTICGAIQQLELVCQRLCASDLNDDKKMASEINNLLNVDFGSSSLLSAAQSYPEKDSNADEMASVFQGIIQTGSFESLVDELKALHDCPCWGPNR